MKLNTKQTFFIGLAFMSICAFWQLYDQIIPLMLDHTFHLNATLIGIIMSFDNILALFMLPFFGSLSDKIDTRLGKRMPFILTGTFTAAVFLILIPIAANMKSIALFIIALALTLIAMQSYRSPAVALMPDLTPKPLLSKANAIINLMGAIGGMLALILISLFVPEGVENYLPLFISLAAIMLVSAALLFITVKEKKQRIESSRDEPLIQSHKQLPKDVKRSLSFLLFSIAFWFMGYNAVTTAFSRYAAAVWDKGAGSSATLMLIATAAATIAYLPIGQLSARFGRKKMIQFGIILLSFSLSAAGSQVCHRSLILSLPASVSPGPASMSTVTRWSWQWQVKAIQENIPASIIPSPCLHRSSPRSFPASLSI